MNEDQIESLLRKAPDPSPPSGLLAQLQSDIAVPRPAVRAAGSPDPVGWFRRWLPALGIAGCMLACVVVLAVQNGTLSQLRRENEALRRDHQGLDQLRVENAEYQKLASASRELERLRKDQQELQALRGEVARLRAEVAEIARLKTENLQLRAGSTRQLARSDADFFDRVPDARGRAERIRCVNNLKQIGLAARIWATDHQDVLPPDFLTMMSELSTPKVLHCPSDSARPEVADWSAFTPGHSSYEMLSPGVDETDPQVAYVRCLVHNNVCLADGSVQQLPPERKVVQRNGRYYLDDAGSGAGEVLRRRYGLGAPVTPSDNAPATTNSAADILRQRYGLPPVQKQ